MRSRAPNKSAPVPRLALLLTLSALACGTVRQGSVLREYRVVRANAQLGQPTWLAHASSDELAGSLSPDGKHLLYASNSKGQFDIWSKDLTTGLPRRLTSDVAEDTQPAWSPDGTRVAFVSRRADAKGDVYLWTDGKVQRLTDTRSAEEHPVFSADGRSVYFASGAVGRTRIERLDLRSARRTPVSDWQATQPTVSRDGRFLAYTWFDSGRRGRVLLQRIADGKRWTVTSSDYHAGFADFSPAGRFLLFCRFHRGAPNAAREPDAVSSLWRLPLTDIVAGEPAEQLMARAEQLTSDRRGVLLPRAHRRGIVLTAQRVGGLDIGLLPATGVLPAALSPAALHRLARAQPDHWEALLLLRQLRQRSERHASAALYDSARLLVELGELHKAQAALERLVAQHPRSTQARLARIDLITLPVERARRDGKRLVVSQRARKALAQLLANRPTPSHERRLQAYALLRVADMRRLGGDRRAAIDRYEQLQRQFPGERDFAASARLRLGELLAPLRTERMLVEYYLSLFSRYPDQRAVLRQAAAAALDQLSSRPPAEQIAQLRRLVDRHRDKKLFCALAAKRLAALYEARGQRDLAIDALATGARRYGGTDDLTATLTFELGRLSFEHSARLREERRFGEALALYDKALAAYKRLVRHYEPATEVYQRARREYLRLSLLDAAQLRRQGEHALSRKRYDALLTFDEEILQAHRGLVQLQLARGGGREPQLAALERRYRAHRSDFVNHYVRGYLATLRQPLGADDLDRAEKLLEQAIALRPQNPFPHLTLGWVYEMRERYFEQADRGWLEEAILAYNRAYALNDGRLDPQTEADLLLNLAGSFVGLGGAWEEVLGFCQRRRELGYPFDSKAQEAMHRLTCGRAGTARGKHELAARQLEGALQLARTLRRPRLETEALARLAVNEHLRGDYAASSRLLEQVRARLHDQNKLDNLAAIDRTLAYNALLAGDEQGALSLLKRAGETLRENGAPQIPAFVPVPTKTSPSTLPLGLRRLDERYAQQALHEIARENRQRWDQALVHHAEHVELQQLRRQGDEFAELGRELLVARNRYAVAAAQLDDGKLFWQQIEHALVEAAELQRSDTGAGPRTLALEVGLALNATDQLLGELEQHRRVPARRLPAIYTRLEQLEQRRAEAEANAQEPLPERLRLNLWTALAQLAFHRALDMKPAPPAPTGSKPTRTALPTAAPGAEPTVRVARALARLEREAQPFTRALELASLVLEQTSPELVSEPALDAPDDGAALERPLSAMERLRWHVLAALNLARLATTWVAPAQLAKHPTTAQLDRLARTLATHELGLLGQMLAGELAFRRGDTQAMGEAVKGFVDRHPLLLGTAELQQATQARRLLFARAIALASKQQKPEEALQLAELEERYAFVHALVRLGPAGSPGLSKERLAALLASAGRHRAVLDRQDPNADPAAYERWRAELEQAELETRRELELLRQQAPSSAQLLEVGDFPAQQLRELLTDREAVVRAIHDGTAVTLIGLNKADGVRAVQLEASLQTLRRDPATALSLVRQALGRVAAQSARLYVDLGAIDPALTDAFCAKGRSVVRLATAWELLDARQRRNVALRGVALAVDDATLAREPTLAARRDAVRLKSTSLTISALERAAEQAGMVVLERPVRFAGASAANVVVELNPGRPDEGDFRPARQLGQPLRAAVLVLTQVTFGSTRRRSQRVALLRLLHAMGVPSVALLPGSSTARPQPPRLEHTLRDLADKELTAALSGAGLLLFGDGSVEPAKRKELARKELRRTVFAGARAFNAKPRQLAQTIDLLETAQRYMDYLEDRKFAGGALLYLANAYGLQEDYGRAVRQMQRLVELREGELKQATQGKAGKAATLKAKAQYVNALRQMAWLRLRNKQHQAALEANAKSIAIYRQVGRPALLRGAFEQRSIINEEKGDYAEALRFARQSLEIALEQARKGDAKTGDRLTAAANATRVAVLERLRFSRYGAALSAVRQALKLLPAPPRGELAQLRKRSEELERASAAAPAGARANLLKQLGAAKAALAGAQRLIATRRDALLERARAYTARGTFAKAVETAEKTQAMLREAGMPSDAAELERVNNLYYMGAYRRALAAADRGLEQSKESPQRTVQFLNARGTALAALGRYEKSLAALRRALRIARRQRISREVAATQNNIGNTQRLAGQNRDARRSFDAALRLDQARDDKLGMSFALANRGLANAALGLRAEAEADLKRAREVAQQIGAPLNQLKALAGLARLALADGNHRSALGRAQDGLKLAMRLGLRDWTWRFQLQMGRAQLALGDRARARHLFRLGVQTVAERPPRPRARRGAPQAEEHAEELYEELIDLLAGDGEAEAALALVQQLHARAFVDLSSADVQEIRWGAARESLGRMTQLQGALEATRASVLRAAEDSERSEAQALGERLRLRLDAERKRLRQLNPRLLALVDPQVVPLSRVREAVAKLPADTALVSYFATPRRLLIWLLRPAATPTEAAKLQLSIVDVTRAQLRQAVDELHRRLQGFSPLGQAAAKLSRWLVQPVLAKTSASRLLFVCGGFLRRVPFAALIDGEGPLIRSRSIVHLPALGSIVEASPTPPATPESYARWVSFSAAGESTAPLPFAGYESAALGRTFGYVQVLQREEATREAFRSLAPGAEHLHLALHARFDADAPLQSSLLLSDGPLKLTDILGMRLTADLVLLSSCDTGSAPATTTDGVSGFDRAFLLAGARRVISSIWRIDDLAAALLMKAFFRELAASQDAASAFRKAQLQLRARHPHPAFWAAFRLVGSGFAPLPR